MKTTKVTHRTLIYAVLLVFFVLTINNCGNTAITYIYSDGSGNSYTIKGNTIEYDPVLPSTSSSGIYSGGDPVKREIGSQDLKIIESMINEAISDKSIQIDKRVMRSGFLKIRSNEKEEIYTLAPDSTTQRELESRLKKLIE